MAVSSSATSRTPCQAGSLFHVSMWAVPSKPSISSVSVRLYSARSCAKRIRCMLFTEIALLCMFVGARRLALANRYSPRPCSTCIQAPTLRSTKRTQLGFHCSKALRLPGRLDVLGHLAHDVGVVAVEGELPLLVRVAELVPAVRRPVVALRRRSRGSARARAGPAPGLQRGPVERVAAPAVGEAVEPALGEVVARVRLDLDGDVLVVGLLALGWVCSSCSCALSESGNSLAPASASVNTGLGKLRPWGSWLSSGSSSFLQLMSLTGGSRVMGRERRVPHCPGSPVVVNLS